MKKIMSMIIVISMIITSFGVLDLSVCASTNSLNAESVFQGKFAKGQALVYMNKSSASFASTYFGSKIKIKKVFRFGKENNKNQIVALLTSSSYSTEEIVKIAKGFAEVKYAEPNYLRKSTSFTDDTYSEYQWALDNVGQNSGTSGEDINVDSIWNSGVKSSEKVIAIVDSGIDFTNEDLQGCFWTNTNTRDLPGLHGYDFVNDDANPQDDCGHGTHCAGIITGLSNNQKGISGVNQNAKIMALKILDQDGAGYDDDIFEAFEYIYEAQTRGVNIVAVNNSWGGDGNSVLYDEIFNKIGEKGALQICAAGNAGENNDFVGATPSNSASPYVVSVAATNEKGSLTSFSNYGQNNVDLAAPGANILSTVSSDTYNPTIYSSEKNAEISNYYNQMNSQIDVDKIKIESASSGTATVSKDDNVYFGNSGSSAKITFSNAKSGSNYKITIPYTAKEQANKKVETSFMIRCDAPCLNYDNTAVVLFDDMAKESNDLSLENAENGFYFYGSNDYWNHEYFEPSSVQNEGQERTITFCVMFRANTNQDCSIYLDDVGVSNPAEDTSVFGKYDFYNGTSMATPYVTGSVGLLSALHKDLTALQLKALIMSSVRKTDELEEKTVSGGTLDLSKALTTDKICPVLNTVDSSNGQITLNGLYFGTIGAVTLNGVAANIVSQTDSKVVIDASTFKYKKVKVTFTNENGKVSSVLYVSGAQGKLTNVLKGYASNNLISDGNNLYSFDSSSGTLYMKFKNSGAFGYGQEYSLLSTTPTEMFVEVATAEKDTLYPEFKNNDEGLLGFDGNAYYLNGKFWMIANYETASNHYKLVSLNISNGKWSIEGDLPTDEISQNYSNSTLTSYNGKLYLLGGYSESFAAYNYTCDKTATNMVRIFDPTSNKWSNGVDMPEARFGFDARQVGNKLVVSYGSDGSTITKAEDSYTVPKTMVFDGTKWTVSKTTQKSAYFNEEIDFQLGDNELSDFSDVTIGFFDEEEICYYKVMPIFRASGGITANSVIYSGLYIEDMGTTVSYNPSTDTFTSLGYSIGDAYNTTPVYSASVGTKYYAYITEPMNDFEEESFSYDGGDDFDDDFDDNSCYGTLYSFSITNGNYKVSASATSRGKITGTGYYLPGQYVTLKAFAKSNYKFSSLTIGSNKYTTSSKTVLVNSNLTVKASFASIPVKSIKLNASRKTLKVKKSFTLKAKITPTNATTKTVKWYTSNKKIATVSSKGVVKAIKAGKVTITCKTKSGGKTAKCYITVKKK